jgi:hypothetical protein
MTPDQAEQVADILADAGGPRLLFEVLRFRAAELGRDDVVAELDAMEIEWEAEDE